MPLRDDDLMLSARAAQAFAARGEYRMGHETVVVLGQSDTSWAMVSRHEQTHLELNLMTTFGLLLRVLATDDWRRSRNEDVLPQFLQRCRTTHEIVATTAGVWWTSRASDSFLDEYPDYVRHLDAGVEISQGLLPGSYAAIAAVFCAGLVAMQAPLGQYLADKPLSAASLPQAAWPDHRLAVLRRAHLSLDEVDVDIPTSWISGRVTEVDASVHDHQRRWGLMASAYYQAFQHILERDGIVSQPYDNVDPAVERWADTVIDARSIVMPRQYTGPSATGPEDPHWQVAASDREQVQLRSGRRLVAFQASALADTPTREHSFCLSHLVGGPKDDKSVLVVVRPLATLLRQYRVDRPTRALLEQAAIAGVVTAVRVEIVAAGELTTVLATLDYPNDFKRIGALASRNGLLGSVSMACMSAWPWLAAMTPTLGRRAHVTVLMDTPRRHLVDHLERTHESVGYDTLQMSNPGGPPIYVLALRLPDFEVFVDRPYVVVGSEHAVRGLEVVLEYSSTINSNRVEGLGGQPDKSLATLVRLLNEEPTFDALGWTDLWSSAKP